uniref:Uncharacterized protein n=1 Tax=Setaria digitata TaxID=48799 RepID=A0A915PNK3_9BILA
MCLLSLITTVAASLLLLYIGISGTAVFPDTATLLARKSADGKSLGFVEPLNLASFNGFNVDIPSNSNIHNRFRFHISGRLIRLQGLTSITWHLVWSDALISHELSNCISLVSDTARCFSCMSRLYEAVWPALSSIYKRPKNFTDLCNDNDLDPQHVPFTYCPTICIRMWEEPTVAGIFLPSNW